jgi:carboxylesterase type B
MFHLRYPLLFLALAVGLNACSEQTSNTETAAMPAPSTSPAAEENTTISNMISIQGEMITANGATARIFRGIPYAAAPVGNLR